MKIQIKNYDKIISVDIDHDDVTIDEVINSFVGCLRAITFSEEVIVNGFKEYLDEHA